MSLCCSVPCRTQMARELLQLATAAAACLNSYRLVVLDSHAACFAVWCALLSLACLDIPQEVREAFLAQDALKAVVTLVAEPLSNHPEMSERVRRLAQHLNLPRRGR